MMMIVDQLVVQHQTLRNKAAENSAALDMNEVMALMDQVQAASAHVENGKQREQLQAILYHWNGYVHEKTGAYPGTQMAAYAPAPNEENTARLTTTRPDISLPQAHWGVWAVAILLFLGGLLIVILPRLGGSEAAAEPDLGLINLMDTAVPATQTALATAASATVAFEVQATAAAAASQIANQPAEPPAQATTGGPVNYTVAAGDTMFGLAQRFGTTVNDIMVMNGLNDQSLAIGQTLIFSNPPLTPAAANNGSTAVVPATPMAPPTLNQHVIEIVIRASSTPLHSGPGPDFSEINRLARGAFVYAVGRNQAGNWYLVQLEDGVTRGWVTADDVAILYPAGPESIPVITTP